MQPKKKKEEPGGLGQVTNLPRSHSLLHGQDLKEATESVLSHHPSSLGDLPATFD